MKRFIVTKVVYAESMIDCTFVEKNFPATTIILDEEVNAPEKAMGYVTRGK